MSRQYITTAIDYPNAPPHMGHVMEKVLADVVARWFRLRGDEVRFQIGTDEHGVKIERKAKDEGVTAQALVDRNVPLYVDLYQRLQISSDDFLRTTDRVRHWPTVQALWKKLQQAGVLEKRTYTGRYCAGCERFMTARDLTDGKCAIHNAVPEQVSEENYFFLLNKETQWLKNLLTKKGGYDIVPKVRAQETLSLIEQGLEDVSFSRPKSSLSWGIPVPDDPDHVMYVWCDALTNYISGLGFFTAKEDRKFWDDAEVTHVIGKDIARFHALIWPAMLKHAGVRTPDRLLIHGFLTSEGQKMSNSIGNLLNRVLVLLKKEGGVIAASGKDAIGSAWKTYREAMDEFRLSDAIQEALNIAVGANEYIDARKVWALPAEEKNAELANLAERLRHIALMLLPFIPQTAQEISRQLNVPYAGKMLEKDFQITEEMKKWGSQKDWKKVGEPRILFAPLS